MPLRQKLPVLQQAGRAAGQQVLVLPLAQPRAAQQVEPLLVQPEVRQPGVPLLRVPLLRQPESPPWLLSQVWL